MENINEIFQVKVQVIHSVLFRLSIYHQTKIISKNSEDFNLRDYTVNLSTKETTTIFCGENTVSVRESIGLVSENFLNIRF